MSAEGKINLDRPINNYLKGPKVHSPLWDVTGATVKRVANHTAGLTSYERVCNVADAHCRASTQTAIERYGILFWSPGDHFDYSNLGYGILGEAISNVSGLPLSAVLDKRIFTPLGLSNCYLPDNGTIRSDSAASYDAGTKRRSPPEVSDTPAASSAHCSAHDLASFGNAILGATVKTGQRFLPQQQIHQLVATYDASAGVPYSFGGFKKEVNGHPGLMAQGGTSEAFAVLQLVPDTDLSISVVANTGTEFPSKVVGLIASELLPPEVGEASKPQDVTTKTPPNVLFGKWSGRLSTGRGQIPFALSITSPTDLIVSVDGHTDVCRNAEVSEKRIYCLGRGNFLTPDGPTPPYDFDLEVLLHGQDLIGAATTSGNTQLPYFVSLNRDSPKM